MFHAASCDAGSFDCLKLTFEDNLGDVADPSQRIENHAVVPIFQVRMAVEFDYDGLEHVPVHQRRR